MKSHLELLPPATANAGRVRLVIRGAVQGVGFRPFVYRLARELRLAGWINNSPQGVVIEAEGVGEDLKQLLFRIEADKPPRSFIQSLETSWLDAVGYKEFEIRKSETGGTKTALVLADIATCADCLREIMDPSNRRHRYPFTNCTHCGPRFSIIEALPYDRANTSMKTFTMCAQCQREYDDPNDRRFHAQPNACPICGPALELWRANPTEKRALERDDKALRGCANAIREGQIVAVKGIGGFHLMADARNEKALGRLRERKHREEKPFAVLFPSVESVNACCQVSKLEERLLCSPEAPIVLLNKIRNVPSHIAHSVAPGNPTLGVMLASNPLHHLLMAELDFPVVATSGNLSDEPICTDEREARERLGAIADLFLVHNRPIVRHVDDSITRVMLDREMVLRRARGYAPLPIILRQGGENLETEAVLAVGAHLKNSIALAIGGQIFMSQHIGDLETEAAYAAFRKVIDDFQKLYEANLVAIVADLHPDYLSTKFARDSGEQVATVQHHIAHVLACMGENEISPPALGVSWDGTGLGLDGTIWGGEFFLVTDKDVGRVAHFRPFRLPGGDQAVKEPRRSALGLLYELFGEKAFELKAMTGEAAFSALQLATLKTMLSRGLNSPWTSSVGRLFDAVAGLIGLRGRIRFEGQAAMELEFALDGVVTNECYPLPISLSGGCRVLDWGPMVKAILADLGMPTGEISARFHNTLVEGVVAIAKQIGEARVVVSGGCFQNRYLTERAVKRLREEGFAPYWHQRVPPNDGGIALGQIVAAKRINH